MTWKDKDKTSTSGRRPTHTIYALLDGAPWIPIGVAWSAEDGSVVGEVQSIPVAWRPGIARRIAVQRRGHE